ncbi:MAG TPA: PKD domain-containing protein [Gaiellaceae bacterium]|nr:PKD domain-containing protein [Gaiellaceae bacterium]
MHVPGGRGGARLALAFAFAALAAVFTVMPTAHGATPASGTLTDTSGPITYTAGPFALANPTPVPVVDSGPECDNPVQPCDDFALTVSLPSDYAETHPNDVIRFTAGWTDSGSGQSDYDLYVYKGTVTNTDGSEAAYTQSASGANPEITAIPVFDGTQTFTVKVVPYTPTAESVNVTIELANGSGGGGGGGSAGFGGPTPTQPGAPRYQILSAPADSGANSSSGEFNIGFDPKTGNIMTNSFGDVFRVTPPEKRTPSLPEAGPALWQNVSPSIASATSLDPILVTDQSTGRTFVSNLTTGANALFAYTDDDGANWTQASAAPPNGGVDHESLGVGPYPAPLAGLNPLYPNAVYYCSQADVTDMCQRSDSGGLQFGPGEPVDSALTGCSSLHGHIRVAPDGTVYLPVKDCGGSEGGAVSTDAGVTWSQFLVPNSGTSQSDPSIGIDKDNTAYYCYTPNDGSAHVAVSHDGGQTWTDDHDIGASVGVVQAVFPEAVAGDSGRAACGFLGTDRAGNLGSGSFPGRWYLFIATTYDGGKTWTTVNATPNDPVQGAGGICLSGIGCTGGNRNLLDFNEVTIDDRGRVLFGYDDGCVSQTCLSSGGATNDFVAYAKVARQTGGKSLYAQYDPAEPTTPKAPYLDGIRYSSKATLTWNAPDNGGSDFTEYRILRGTSPGSETQIATVGGDKNQYVDATVDATVGEYYYEVVAVNGQGAGPASNEVGLPVSPDPPPPPTPCTAPGLTTLTDASGDSTPGTAGTDLRSLQVSQPYSSDGSLKLRFQLNTDPGMSQQPPDSYWYASFREADGTVHGVRMWFDPNAPNVPTFQSYIAGGNTSGTVDGRFVQSGSEKPADPASFYDPATGTIVIVASAADLGLQAGDTVTGFNAASVQAVTTPVLGAAETLDEMPDGLAYQGSFSVQSNDSCAPNTAPTAALTASPRSGNVPLQVAFDGSGSSDTDPGDSIASYTFDFGDGSAPVTQSTPTTTHTYTNAGEFKATLTVTDPHGRKSINDASVVIGVQPTVTCFEDDSSNIAYAKGWHTVKDTDATAGHFRTSNGSGLSFTFQTSASSGTLTYRYATAKKAGTADLYLDGSKVQSVSYAGSSGAGNKPVFGASVSVPLSGSGTHTFALQNTNGLDFVDQICVTDGSSSSQPSSAPGETTTSTDTLQSGETLDPEQLFVPANAKSISVLAESSTSVPFAVAVLDVLGNVVHTARSSDGVASLDVPVGSLGLYTIQVVDLGLGPVTVWSAATPYLGTS